MGRYLDGPTVPFKTAAQRRALVGKTIRYLRDCDIDRSGRGYYFPRIDTVEAAEGLHLFLTSGSTVSRGELVEVEIIRAKGEHPYD